MLYLILPAALVLPVSKIQPSMRRCFACFLYGVVCPPVALLVALRDGAVKAAVYPSGQFSVIGYLQLDLWRF